MPKKNYRCNICDEPEALFHTRPQMIAHYRKQHPQDGYNLWDAIGELGDAFSNKAMADLRFAMGTGREQLAKAEGKAKAYDDLVRRYNALIRAVQIIKPAVDGAIEETNRT